MQTPLLSFWLVSMSFLVMVMANGKDAGYWHGRATFYTDNSQGSCHYGAPSDIYYAAWPNVQEGAPQCGNCFEVSCVNADFHDGFGQATPRSSACYDENKKVVVKIIDSCPCEHANWYSNQRWCCGDMDHMDLSSSVFQLLADQRWGVIGLKFKQTSCDNLGPVKDGDNGGSKADKGSGTDNTATTDQGNKGGATGSPPSPPANEDNQDGANSLQDKSGLKKQVSSWDSLSDSDSEQRWNDMLDKADSLTSQTKSKWKLEKPSWVKSMFKNDGWRR